MLGVERGEQKHRVCLQIGLASCIFTVILLDLIGYMGMGAKPTAHYVGQAPVPCKNILRWKFRKEDHIGEQSEINGTMLGKQVRSGHLNTRVKSWCRELNLVFKSYTEKEGMPV